MADQQPRSVTYIVIQERSPRMPILYLSSSVRQALLYEPDEVVGKATQEYLVDNAESAAFKEHYGTATDDNVIISNIHAMNKNNVPVLIRTIAFTCGNVNFHMSTTHPNIAPFQVGNPLSVQRFKCILSEARDENSGGAGSNGSGDVDLSTVYSMKTTSQACIVLENANPSDPDSDAGPTIVFSTDSINRILDVDSCDLQD
ncbi:hypothetical protein GGI12_006102, partial [Dipsacomyces acuminosporus]